MLFNNDLLFWIVAIILIVLATWIQYVVSKSRRQWGTMVVLFAAILLIAMICKYMETKGVIDASVPSADSVVAAFVFAALPVLLLQGVAMAVGERKGEKERRKFPD